jgi:hypothetical protein
MSVGDEIRSSAYRQIPPVAVPDAKFKPFAQNSPREIFNQDERRYKPMADKGLPSFRNYSKRGPLTFEVRPCL